MGNLIHKLSSFAQPDITGRCCFMYSVGYPVTAHGLTLASREFWISWGWQEHNFWIILGGINFWDSYFWLLSKSVSPHRKWKPVTGCIYWSYNSLETTWEGSQDIDPVIQNCVRDDTCLPDTTTKQEQEFWYRKSQVERNSMLRKEFNYVCYLVWIEF